MFSKKSLMLLCMLICAAVSKAQIEVAHITMKNFKSTGFGGFLNFSFHVTDANYLTLEGGLQYFKDNNDQDAALVPVLLGYRYTINHTGTGLYVEPNAGYCFGATSIERYDSLGGEIIDANGNQLYEKIAGPMAGVGIGYLFEPGGKIQFNIALRYEHTFGDFATNVFAFRISHAFTFGRREE